MQAFIPETFWYIYLSIDQDAANPRQEKNSAEFHWERVRLFDFEVSLAIYEGVIASPTAQIRSVQEKPAKKWKPLPLTTVELQKCCSRLLKLAPKRILDVSVSITQTRARTTKGTLFLCRSLIPCIKTGFYPTLELRRISLIRSSISINLSRSK